MDQALRRAQAAWLQVFESRAMMEGGKNADFAAAFRRCVLAAQAASAALPPPTLIWENPTPCPSLPSSTATSSPTA